jgi:hypothetical protein
VAVFLQGIPVFRAGGGGQGCNALCRCVSVDTDRRIKTL